MTALTLHRWDMPIPFRVIFRTAAHQKFLRGRLLVPAKDASIRPLLAPFLRETHKYIPVACSGIPASDTPGGREQAEGLRDAGPFRVCASRSLFARSPLAGVSAAGQPPPSPMDGLMRLPREGNAQRGEPEAACVSRKRGQEKGFSWRNRRARGTAIALMR